MQFSKATTFFLLALGVSAIPTMKPNNENQKNQKPANPAEIDNKATSINPALVPIFKIKAGSGIGANNVAIPKDCPPARDDFIKKLSENVAAGNVLGRKITFNTDAKITDVKTQKDRATAMIITLQSFSGKEGVGCPGASTPELLEQQKTGIMSAA